MDPVTAAFHMQLVPTALIGAAAPTVAVLDLGTTRRTVRRWGTAFIALRESFSLSITHRLSPQHANCTLVRPGPLGANEEENIKDAAKWSSMPQEPEPPIQ